MAFGQDNVDVKIWLEEIFSNIDSLQTQSQNGKMALPQLRQQA